MQIFTVQSTGAFIIKPSKNYGNYHISLFTDGDVLEISVRLFKFYKVFHIKMK